MPEFRLPRSNRLSMFIVGLILWLAVTLRWIYEFIDEGHPLTLLLGLLLGLYGVLLIGQSLWQGGSHLRTHLYLAVQTGLVLIAALLYFELDFFAILFLPLAGEAVLTLPRRAGRIWLGVLILATLIGQITQFGWPGALSFAVLYIAGLIFVALFSESTLQAERARAQSEALLEELRQAHQQLQEAAVDAQALAAAQERNRLARDLHDSVAQTLYGLTLRSEAALRNLAIGNHERVAAYLRDFQSGAKQSLQEIRLLIYELRPEILAQEGLRAALVHRLEFVERRSGLAIEMDIKETPDLPEEVEEALFRIALEALNNTLNHAQATQVQVHLRQEDDRLLLVVADDGVGFDHGALGRGPENETPSGRPVVAGGLGLRGMQERADAIGANLDIHSAPGEGAHVTVEVTL